MRTHLASAVLALSLLSQACADARDSLELAPVFTDHMVLQRGQPIEIWGRAEAGVVVGVSLGDAAAVAVTDPLGAWSVELEALDAGGPYELVVGVAGRELSFEDVLIGDVWLCSGQSNMRWQLDQSEGGDAAAAGADLPQVRLFDMQGGLSLAGTWSERQLADASIESGYQAAQWTPCTPRTAASFSGVGYWFGRDLHERTGVTIGLICNAIGGSPIEAWTSLEAMGAETRLPAFVSDPRAWLEQGESTWARSRARQNLGRWLDDPTGALPGHPFLPGFLFDSGIRPLAGLGLRGVIWYQGESNATDEAGAVIDPERYRVAMQTLIANWRRTFAMPDLPFLFVQLPGIERDWAAFREAQRRCLEIPGTGMAVTIDIGDAGDVHPRNKREVGRRLALLAADQVLGLEVVGARSPNPVEFEVEGARVHLRVADDGGGLATTDGAAPRGFELVGDDGTWQPAAATLDGDRIVVISEAVPTPVAARYAFAPLPDCNVVGGTGLPLTPFVEGRVPQ
ncbi:sialate O-acetylesterase [Engelhardtia mirabilis]|uniref:Sialate O-acetylesterase domain-containing protein n=1 Tax=Engelhardtia mirabilis TaxID=2528011 RepID=A0A518BR92_9BACT|nr:hypothetical protein Pla133_46090 [Planctomycetes bacterium Pla133]QDV03815.1 hypothetical protein Pla86_46070 [Planctomycetes bacterium Pla86]